MYPSTSIGYVRHFGFPFEFNTPTLVHGVALTDYRPNNGDLIIFGTGIDLQTPWAVGAGTAKAALFLPTATTPITIGEATPAAVSLESSTDTTSLKLRNLLPLLNEYAYVIDGDYSAIKLVVSTTGVPFATAKITGSTTVTFPLVVSATSTANKITVKTTTYESTVAAASYANVTTLLAALNGAPATGGKTALSTILTFGHTGNTITVTFKAGSIHNGQKLGGPATTALATHLKLKTRAASGGGGTPVTAPTAGVAVAHLSIAPGPIL